MPYVLGHMLKSMPQSRHVCALVVWKSKGIKHIFKVWHVPALLCLGGTRLLCCPAAGRCISISQQLAEQQ